jgi:ATP-binding cassette subfamily C (CFTR/MRP) protein 4
MRTLYKMFMHLYITTVSATLVQHFTLYLVIMTYVWSGKSITAEVMYFVVGCFQGVTFTLVTLIPYGMFHTSEFIAAAKRIQKLLRIIGNERNMEEYKSEVKEAHISLRNVTVILADKKILSDVNFDIKKGLTVLTGNTGSGKSVLVMTLLKQYEITEGTLLIEGRLSYASQDSWLFPSTIRQNILFGERYNVQRYQQVLKVCALHHDFNSFEFGDDTVVADRGINLSKGQRTRISLARAIYRESDIYLLDDCLSSLDPLVADFIFKNCIRKFLADKLVVLITYNENFIRQADNVINMNQNGPIVSIKASTEAIEEIENESPIENVLRVNDQREGENTNVDGKLLNERENRVNVYREDKKSGAVSWRVYQQYIKLGGSSFAFVSIFCISILAQFSTSYKDKLVSKW